MAMAAGRAWDENGGFLLMQGNENEGVEFNGPNTRLEFLDVEGSCSDTQEQYLNRPLSQIDIRDTAHRGLVDTNDPAAGHNAITSTDAYQHKN